MKARSRELLLKAMLRELGEKGREGIEPARVLPACMVSAEEFTAEFADVDACLDAAYDELSAQIATEVQVGCKNGGSSSAGSRSWPSRVRAGLDALLGTLADDPPMAHILIRTFPSLGGEARRRYQAFTERFVPLLAEGREHSGVAEELPSGVELLAIGAAEAIIFEEVASGRAEQLPELGPSILFSLLVPFLGPISAAAEMEKAQQRR